MFWFFGQEGCGSLAPWPGIKPALLAVEGEVLTTEPPRKSCCTIFVAQCSSSSQSSVLDPPVILILFGISMACVMLWPQISLEISGAQHSENKDHGIIPPWQIYGETVPTVSDFILGGSKITADGDCNHKIKRRLLLGRKVVTNLDSIFKSRDITLPTKVPLVKTRVFPVVMYGCDLHHKESWAPKNWCFWTVVLKKSFESPLDSKEIKPV